jgi:hypothetical protein
MPKIPRAKKTKNGVRRIPYFIKKRKLINRIKKNEI